tara:strand:- start:357 stop:491 length:135 start_codon:yes stop_codon:yes gene_type:complete
LSIHTTSSYAGILLILIGMIVKFEVKVITSEEQKEIGERGTKQQ